ncbi:MAG: TetR/AcrR family transcriptional regulator [Flavobacteriales bacterium]|nr:TetR/AcrR family transcriptional regulator [Flavobacteriales bacterium]
MGRQSLVKARIRDPKKREAWARKLFPLFMERGIQGVSMDEMAAALGKSKATVYKHFESQKDIIAVAIAQKLEDLRYFQAILEDAEKGYTDRYILAVASISRHLGDVSTLFLSDLKQVYPELWEMINGFKLFALSVLKHFYEEGIAAGVFEAIDTDILVLSDELFFDVLTNPEFLTRKDINLRFAFESYFRMRFNGILKR